ncbi:hypothetical protein E5A73_20415 [Sphingomonas gei]|uniref:Uncharacterized protein n=1 Tax=Sphingomonas gei TaxID=1395960 RepID=A0A4S1X015_9SPHN|nr:hypothetical protein [Sphingomonas gei]TGX49201.1 hypothetical protein E5A73_20415 [Sphingomonas gei]
MFTVHPDEIKDFTGDQLVALLRRLLYAEARKAGVPLRGVEVPLQITVADGGQDGSISWEGGKDSTDYFPGRDIIFQCKAKDSGDAQWKREVWTKPTQPPRIAKKELSDAVQGVLTRGGSYIGITAKPLVSPKPDDRVKAIREGIRLAGGDPDKLTAIKVYEGNALAAWASTHPAVAVWIKQINARIDLAGFSTLDHWGTRADITTPAFVDSPDRRFSLGPQGADAIDFSQLAERLADELDQPRTSARIWGASGIGKTRSLYHALSSSTGLLGESTAANFIFCDLREVRDDLWKVANQIVKERSVAVLVVDGCPLDEARRLNEIARSADSELRIITVGADGTDHDDQCVMVRPTQADRATIRGILKAGLPKAKSDELDYLADFCDGFPRIAVLAIETYGKRSILKSADDVAQQMLNAAGADRETIRALECLSLFDKLSPNEDPRVFDDIAETLVHMKGELMYENLVIAAGQHLVGRSYGAMNAQPRPIADFLGRRRLDYLRSSTLIDFLDRARTHHRDAMLARWRYLRPSPTLSEVIGILLRGILADEKIVHPDAAAYLSAVARVEPNRIARALFDAIGRQPLDDLAAIPVTDGLLDALRYLAGRQDSFWAAASIILRLAAVAATEGPPPIVSLLRQIFQVAAAGTQANDRHRREALEQALEEDDPRIRRAGVEALGGMIQTYLTRSGEFEQTGAEPFRPEWLPPDRSTMYAYFNWALERMREIWAKAPELRGAIEEHVAGDLRNLLAPELLPTIDGFVREVVAHAGHYFKATKRIGDWLYFDSPEKPTKFSRAVRALYDATLPVDPVDRALLHSRFWMSDLHDPDKRYAQDQDKPDYDRSARIVAALTPDIAQNPEQRTRAIHAFATRKLHSPGPFAVALADHLADPVPAFETAIRALDASGKHDGADFVGSLLAALDKRLIDHPEKVTTLVAIARASTILAANPIYIPISLRVTDDRLDEFTADVRDGKVSPRQSAVISHGRRLEQVSMAALKRFIVALLDRGQDGGGWAALEILSLLLHDNKAPTPEMLELVKLALLSPSIADDGDGHAANSEYNYDRMFQFLDASAAIDSSFARAIALQIEQACRTTGARYGRPSDALRVALAMVVKRAPEDVWPVLAGFYEIATRVERERLNSVVSASKPFAYDELRTGAGALFETPLTLMLDWVKADPDARIGFLLTFFPILEQRDDAFAWHPALEQLAKLYGARKRFRDALRQRIYPSSWGGSLNPHLTSFKGPLAAWTKDRGIGSWATSMLDSIQRSLESNFYGR